MYLLFTPKQLQKLVFSDVGLPVNLKRACIAQVTKLELLRHRLRLAQIQGSFLLNSPFLKLFGVICLIFLCGCEDRSLFEEKALKKQNQHVEVIARTSSQKTFIPPMTPQPLPSYPWQKQGGKHPQITKEHFRCRGHPLNPVKSEVVKGEKVKYHDCGGAKKHSLPLIHGQEGVYPILITLVNYIQAESGGKVVITSGHRCPDHNLYADPSPANQYAKHQMGAAVDFYVQGYEKQPEKIIALIMKYYQNHPEYKSKKEWVEFKRYEKGDSHTSIQPWMNKEVFIKLFLVSEGRNFDNRHPYPYISLQVRYDPIKNERVVYSWNQAYKQYLRY